MNIGLFLSLVLSVSAVQAAPVVNMGTPAGEGVNVYPDHVDGNLYYLSPYTISIARTAEGKPNISYFEFRESGFFSPIQAGILLLMAPRFNSEAIEQATKRLLSHNPQAKFAALPVIQTSIVFDEHFQELIEESACNHGAGDLGQLVSCSMRLTAKGRATLRKTFSQGGFLTVNYRYSISGMLQNPDRSYQSIETSFSVAGMIGGPEFVDFPKFQSGR